MPAVDHDREILVESLLALIEQRFDLARSESKTGAIVLRIESPGGAVGPSQEIYGEVKKTTATKKVVASFGGVAASGGYYSAAAADGIMANPGTITGSIGVIGAWIYADEVGEKVGMAYDGETALRILALVEDEFVGEADSKWC